MAQAWKLPAAHHPAVHAVGVREEFEWALAREYSE